MIVPGVSKRHCIAKCLLLASWFHLITVVYGYRISTENQGQGKAGNDRPIIGILAVDTDAGKPEGKTFVSATYVRFLEQAGARVVPIRGGQPDEYYTRMVNWTNGVLIPGGHTSLKTSLIARSAKLIFEKALELNKRGDHYPMWGTCMGFQMLLYLVQGQNLLQPTDSLNISWPLTFTEDAKSSRMFGKAPADIMNSLSSRPLTQNNHHYGILTKDFEASKLSNFFNKLSVNNDRKGVEFVSTIEGKEFPFYATQWHPEKNNFNWNPRSDINHSPEAVRVSQYMADFFVGEARKSSHHFPSVHEEAINMIENFKVIYRSDGTFYTLYFPDPRDD